MLAEPRRRVKYSVNPRGTDWANDDSKFGQKMLEKMGWSKGKGLGAAEDGKQEHVKVALKNDKKGVGCSTKYADKWIAHQDDFNALLANLNQDNPAAQEEEKGDEVTSLEHKAKTNKGKIYYKRFARGKDLSLRDTTDLDCVFGRRKSKSSANTPLATSQANSAANSDGETQSDPETSSKPAVDASMGLQTITSSCSVAEYFAKKMEELKRKREGGDQMSSNMGQASTAENEAGDEKVEENKKTVSFYVDGESKQSDEIVSESTKKKSKKNKSKKNEKESVVENDCEIDESQTGNSKKSKKKKKKRHEEKEDIESPVELCEDVSVSKKKKKKKNKEMDIDVTKETEISNDSSDISLNSSKKKRKNVEEIEEVPPKKQKNESEHDEEKQEIKKKKNKKSKKSNKFSKVLDEKVASLDKAIRKTVDKTKIEKLERKKNTMLKIKEEGVSTLFPGSSIGNISGYGK